MTKSSVMAGVLRIGLILSLLVAVCGCGDDSDRPPLPTATPTTTSMPTTTATPTITSAPTPTATPIRTASFQGIGILPGDVASVAYGISRDGSTVVGASVAPDDAHQAVRWRAASGIEGLGFPPGKTLSDAFSANQDGSVIVGNGTGDFATAPRGARWSESAGWELLRNGADDFNVVDARGISAGGNTIAGTVEFTEDSSIAPVLWTPTALQMLGKLDGQPTTATDVSADGTVVSGFAFLTSGTQPVRWTSDTGLEALPFLAGTDECLAQRVSADGTTIVGRCGPMNDPEAVLWDSRGVVGLGDLPNGIGSFLENISGDGSVGVGGAGNAQGDQHAAIWTAATGMRDLREVLLGLGLEAELEGWVLLQANAISSDGHVIVGFGTDPQGREQGFVATLP